MNNRIDSLFSKELEIAKKDLLFSEIKLGEHILSDTPLDLSIGWAVTFSRSNLAYIQFKISHTKKWVIKDKPWWINELKFIV